jgi:hypothetical protein
MLVKIIVVLWLLAIVATLLVSARAVVKDDSSKRRLLNLLKLRVVLSVSLVAFVIFAWYMGWLLPHSAMPK